MLTCISTSACASQSLLLLVCASDNAGGIATFTACCLQGQFKVKDCISIPGSYAVNKAISSLRGSQHCPSRQTPGQVYRLYRSLVCGVQIKEIVKLAPRKRQTLLFSATMTEQVQQLVTMSLKSPVRLAADAAGRAPEELRQEIVRLKVCTHSRLMGPRCPAWSTVYPCVLID